MVKQVRFSGTTALTGADGAPLAHAIEVAVDAAGARVGLRGLGGGGTGEVRDGHPAVSRHWHRIDDELRRTAYKERPVVSRFKDPRPAATMARGMAPCPACGGLDMECGLCEGAGAVSRFAAQEWVDQHAEGE